MAETKVPPSVTLFKQFEERLAQGALDLTGVVKLGAQYLLELAVEYEAKQMLGRDYYPHATPELKQNGRRSGYEKRRVLTAEGAVEVKLPQGRGGKQPFHSKIVEAYVARTASLEELPERPARAGSARPSGWPHRLGQRGPKHRIQNVLERVPVEHPDEVKAAIYKAFHPEGSYEEGLALARQVVEKYEKKFPEAMRILSTDLESCLTVLKLPGKHRRAVRTTNLLERLFGENRRRTKVIPHFFQEGAAMKLIYATLVAASQKWRGVEITPLMYRELSALRDKVLPREEWQHKAIA